MKLKSIILKNYGIFYGVNELNFDEGSGDIYIIRGKNGYGKTTIINAIYYALYGTENEGIVNRYASSVNENTCEVRIEFEHEGNYYSVLRGMENNTEKYSVKVNNIEKDIEIRDILPKTISQLSFFDGEKIAKIVDITENNGLEDILGIDDLRTIYNDLVEIHKELNESVSYFGQMRWFFRNRKIEKKINEMIAEKSKLIKEKNTEQKRMKDISARLSSLNKILEKNKEISVLKTKYKEIKEMEEKWKNNLPYILVMDIFNDAIKEISKRKDERLQSRIELGKLISQEELLYRILNEKRCICGAKISTTAYGKSEIRKLLSDIETRKKKIGNIYDEVYSQSETEIRNAIEKMRTIDNVDINTVRKTKTEIETRLKKYYDENVSIEEIEKKIENLRIEQKIREMKIDEINEKIKDIEERIWDLSILLRVRTRKGIEKRKANATKMMKVIGEYIDYECRKRLSEIEKSTTDILKTVTNKPDEFKNVYVDNEGIHIAGKDYELSYGEKHVLALSYIGALKRDMLVIDAPFIGLDNEHKMKLIQRLPDMADKVILLVTDAELSDEELKMLRPKIYNIVHDKIKHVSYITQVR